MYCVNIMSICCFSLGSSASAAREQLLHSARVYLRPESYERYWFRTLTLTLTLTQKVKPNENRIRYSALVPNLRWFQSQREALGNEAWLYSMVEICRAGECLQFGFDETSIDGVPTLNQWVLLDLGPELPPRVVTIQCAGLLVGSKATGNVYPNQNHSPKPNTSPYP